jgi:DNA topoisomerase-1
MNNIIYGGGDKQWNVLHHNGPMFPPEYEPHNIPIIYNNKKIVLPIKAEEYATMYVDFIDTPYINNTFKKNFWKDFKPLLPENINSLDEIDFSLIKNHIISLKEKKNNLSLFEKEMKKKQQEILEEPYKYCIIDGTQQKVGNYKIEPPGIFRGRGNHPKLGRVKKRIYPEDVTINLSKDAKIPIPNIKGHKWGNIIHDQSVIWLASWKDEITDKIKYVFTSFESFFKSKSDESKFDLARQLKKKVSSIREKYELELLDDNLKTRQLATALYLIDKLALRVGGSKDIHEEADTVGVTSLRVEHINLLEDNIVKLDFLGKDSVRFCKKVNVHPDVYNNLLKFISNKNKKDDIFDLITASTLNLYLNSFMENLTAKVWRTYNASILFQKELDKIKVDKVLEMGPNEKLNYLIAMFNQANTEVALLCNHQKNVDKSIDNMIQKFDTRINELKENKKKYIKNKKNKDKINKIDIKIKSLKLKKETKMKMKNVSLGTSKNNYIDPRIIFAFIKKFDIPPEKLFTKVLLKRFEWANNIDKNYRF